MIYVIDTHALVWYLEGDNKLGPKAREIMRGENKRLIIPTIVLAEIRYLFSKGKIDRSLNKIFEIIEEDARCIVYPLDVNVVEFMPSKLEIHDAIICATAMLYRDLLSEDVKVITRDEEITSSQLIDVVW